MKVACSITVTPSQQKNKGPQVVIQGNQINCVTDLLLGKAMVPCGLRIRVHSDEHGFLPNSLPKLHAIQSTLTIFHEIITDSQYRQPDLAVKLWFYS